MHQIHLCSRRTELVQGLRYRSCQRRGIIIANPHFEQVTQNIQRGAVAAIVCQELEQRTGNVRAGGLEMEVGYEEQPGRQVGALVPSRRQ